MIGVFVKELRENAKWASVIFGVLTVFFLHEIRDADAGFLFQFAHSYTMSIAPLAGLLMGVVQTLFDARPDNWAFSVHRPIPRLRIFIAKCAAGLLLLYGSMIFFTAIASMWAERTGHIDVPYQFRMSLPMLADDLMSGCYYFVGMLLALRRARWYGSRLLPLGIVLLASGLVTMMIGPFWQAVLIILVVQSIGAIAAWGSFSTHGECDGTPVTRLALAILIWPGALLLGMVLFMLTNAFDSGGEWRYYQVDNKGRPVLVTQRIDRDQRSFLISDLASQPIPEYKNADLDDPSFANLFLRFTGTLGDSRMLKWPIDVMNGGHWYRDMNPGIIRLSAVAPPGLKLRFAAMYNAQQRLIQIYDPTTCTQIGTVTPDGFAGAGEPARGRFPGEIHNIAAQGRSHVMAFDSIVYRVELDQRRVRPIFSAPADDPVFAAAEFGPEADPVIAVATTHRLHLLHTDGDEIFATTLPFDPKSHYSIATVVPSNHHLLLDTATLPGLGEYDRKVLEYAPEGTLLKTTALPQLPEFRGPKLHETAAFGAMFPIAVRPILPSWILDEVLDIRSEAFASVFEGFMIGSATLCAAATILLARRCGFGTAKTISWTVANFLLGPAGVLTMLSIHQWPAREVCPACGCKRLCWHRECTRCGAPLPPPDLDGREIFDPADQFQPAM